jgi:glycosyltransferase involved in cell wall biosynthesis
VKILVVNWQDRLNPQAGGAEIHLHEIFGRLARSGHQVTLLTSGFSGGAPRENVDGMEVHRTGTRMTFGLRAQSYYRTELASAGFDVAVEDLNKVPVFMPWWGTPPLVLLVHHLFGATAFAEAPFPMALATWLLERPIPMVYRDIPTVAVSGSTALDLEVRGLDRGEIAIVPNGVDLARYVPDPRGRRSEEPTLLYLGRLKRYKGVHLILQAMARLKKAGRSVRLTVAGDGDHRAALEALRDRLQIQDRVEFLGYVDEEEKLRLLQQSWIHVLTSPKEGWGIATLEAAACGTPTVASDSPGLRDAVVDGKTGVLVPHGDVENLAHALAGLLSDDETRTAMGESARAFAEGFSWDASARAMEKVLHARVARDPVQE